MAARKPINAIRTQTRHKKISGLDPYIRDIEIFENNAAAGIGL